MKRDPNERVLPMALIVGLFLLGVLATALQSCVGTAEAAPHSIGVGTSAWDGTGDTPRRAYTKANSNFVAAPHVFWVGTNFGVVANTTTETLLIPNDIGLGTNIIVAAGLTNGSLLRVTSTGHMSTTATPSALGLRVILGTVTNLVSYTPPANMDGHRWWWETVLRCQGGASTNSTYWTSYRLTFEDPASSGAVKMYFMETQTAAVNTTTNMPLRFTAKWTTGTGHSMGLYQLVAERVR